MFQAGEVNNPDGRNGKNSATQQLVAALDLAAKGRNTTIYTELANLFFKSDKMKLAMLPYIVPRLKTLEVSGQVSVPFQFVIERANGDPVELPKPVKQIASNTLPMLDALAIKQKAKSKATTIKRSTHARSRKAKPIAQSPSQAKRAFKKRLATIKASSKDKGTTK